MVQDLQDWRYIWVQQVREETFLFLTTISQFRYEMSQFSCVACMLYRYVCIYSPVNTHLYFKYILVTLLKKKSFDSLLYLFNLLKFEAAIFIPTKMFCKYLGFYSENYCVPHWGTSFPAVGSKIMASCYLQYWLLI
jgi:hypothetical protein